MESHYSTFSVSPRDRPTPLSAHIDGSPRVETGSTPFGPLTIQCRPPVLIPRPETADVFLRLARVLRDGLGRVGSTGKKEAAKTTTRTKTDRIGILDLYTGSGVIGLLLAHELQGWQSAHGRAQDSKSNSKSKSNAHIGVLGVDLNPLAVDLARINGESLGLDRYARFVRGDALDLDGLLRLVRTEGSTILGGRGPRMIVANPPYIPLAEYVELSSSVKGWEDVDALLGDGEHGQVLGERESGDGLRHYRALAGNVSRLVSVEAGDDDDDADGWDEAGLPRVAVEIGDGQGDRVRGILESDSDGWIERTECWRDLYGRERMVVGWR